MMDEKTYNKMVAANLRRLMPCRKYIATPLIMSIWNTRRKPSARSKIHSKTNRRTNKKSPAKRQIERLTGCSTAGSGGRTRTEPYVYRVDSESCQNSYQITPTIPVYPRCYNREPLPV